MSLGSSRWSRGFRGFRRIGMLKHAVDFYCLEFENWSFFSRTRIDRISLIRTTARRSGNWTNWHAEAAFSSSTPSAQKYLQMPKLPLDYLHLFMFIARLSTKHKNHSRKLFRPSQLHAGYIPVTYYPQLKSPLFIGTIKRRSSIKTSLQLHISYIP